MKPLQIGNVCLPSNVTLAPMAGYGDIAFRRLCKDCGAGLTVTEMVSAKGLVYGNEKTEELLRLAPCESPSCVQLFGAEPEFMAKAVAHEALRPFDIIDINMGCPVPKITKNGEGSALMKTPLLASKVIESAVKAAEGRPVTVKFRLGVTESTINAVPFARMAQDSGAAAITVHGRTASMMYSGEADWDKIAAVAASVSIPVIGNGDVADSNTLFSKLQNSGCKGVAIGRGALGNPQIFMGTDMKGTTKEQANGRLVKRAILFILIKHIKYACLYFPQEVAVRNMRKHLHFYLKGIDGAKAIKNQLNAITNAEELLSKITNLLL